MEFFDQGLFFTTDAKLQGYKPHPLLPRVTFLSYIFVTRHPGTWLCRRCKVYGILTQNS
jgi:hypothetical protein